MVNIALGNANVGTCAAGDADHDGQVTIDEVLTAVNNALYGCGVQVPTRTPTMPPSPTSTPTFTATNTATRTPSDTPSSTPTAPNTETPSSTPTTAPCHEGENESIFPVVASGDDGTARRWDPTTYPPGQYSDQDSLYHSLLPERSLNTGGAYYATTVGLIRWNTATQPDGTAWPANTLVTGAFFRARYAQSENDTIDGDALVLEWYSWMPPISDADWTNDVPAPGGAMYAGTDALANFEYRSTTLTHVNQINLSAYTGIRASISGGPPMGANSAQFYSWDYNAGELTELLVVCWVTMTPTPVPTSAVITPTLTPSR